MHRPTNDDQADRLSVRPSNACIVTKQKQLVKQVQLWLIGSYYELSNKPKMNKEGLKNTVTVFRIKVDLSCKRSMLLVFWHRQRLRLVQSIVWPMSSPTTHPKLTHPAARFLCDSWTICWLWDASVSRRSDVSKSWNLNWKCLSYP